MSSTDNILVIGKGHLGSYLADEWLTRHHWVDNMANLTSRDIKLINPSAVVIAAGKTNLQWCENNPQACWVHNVLSPCEVCQSVRVVNPLTPIFHLSTGCAWQGPYRNGEPFRPYDKTEPVCEYTRSKVECDNLLLERFKNIFILRPRLLYSANFSSPRNTLAKINNYPNLIDTPNSMTSVRTVAKTIEVFTHKYLNSLYTGKSFPFTNKIINVYDRGVISPYQVGCLLHLKGWRKHPHKITKEELNKHHKPKRADVVLHDPVFEHLVNPPYVVNEILQTLDMAGQPKW